LSKNTDTTQEIKEYFNKVPSLHSLDGSYYIFKNNTYLHATYANKIDVIDDGLVITGKESLINLAAYCSQLSIKPSHVNIELIKDEVFGCWQAVSFYWNANTDMLMRQEDEIIDLLSGFNKYAKTINIFCTDGMQTDYEYTLSRANYYFNEPWTPKAKMPYLSKENFSNPKRTLSIEINDFGYEFNRIVYVWNYETEKLCPIFKLGLFKNAVDDLQTGFP